MNSFLYKIASELLNNEDLGESCLVFPNRRAGLFFTKYLGEIIDKPIWMPTVMTINEISQKISKLQLADDLTLIFELYKVYKQKKKTTETFDEFYYWGEMLLNDFDDIDKELVDAEDIFRNIKSLKDIEDQFEYLSDDQRKAVSEFWKNFNPEKYSKEKDDFIQIWSLLSGIYKEFNAVLSKQGIAYEGKIYKEVVEKIKNESIEIDSCKKIYFIGFNALNKCEKELFKYLNDAGKASFYWDYDNYYINNEKHEAGFFLRDNIKKLPNASKDISFDNINTSDKNIDFISVSSEVGQAKLIAQKLDELKKDKDFDYNKTAIVLANEDLLLPVLYSLPNDVPAVNITMGYPVKNTPVFSLIEQVLELQKNLKTDKNGSYKFYYKNVLSILNHQYLQVEDKDIIKEITDRIVNFNIIYVSPDIFEKSDLLKSIFIRVTEVDGVAEYLLDVLHKLYVRLSAKEEDDTKTNIEQEYIYRIYLEINKLKEIIHKNRIEFTNIDTVIRLLKQVIQGISIPFTGEPLEGLQVMGILETRVLDFENIIVLSMNEGVLPATGASPSFIPYSLRSGFGMPTIEHQDAIYAYYFYRLLQRAKNVSLYYNTSVSFLSTGEMSRFMSQLKYETNYTINEKTLNFDINISESKEITVAKGEDIQQKLNEYLNNGRRSFSPSAINSYIDCSLKFYYRYIAGLKEADEVSEEIDAADFGNVLHETMHLLYSEFENKLVNSKDLETLYKNNDKIKDAIYTAFKTQYFKVEADEEIELTGRNILIYEVLLKYVKQLIKNDIKYLPFTVVGLEKRFKINPVVNINGKDQNVNISGTIDRIDRREGVVRVLDYKTGGDKNEFSDLASLFDHENEKRNKAVLQTFLYSYAYKTESNDGYIVQPGIYKIKDVFNSDFKFEILHVEGRNKAKVMDYNKYSDEFESLLKETLADIFNKDIDFSQVADGSKVCQYCPYSGLCYRN